MNYVSYYRTSTKDQTLGIEVQQAGCRAYCQAGDHTLVSEYSEHESGKNNDRAELSKAVECCRQSGATLLVYKLDRLTRDVAFGMTLAKSGLNIRALDAPEFGDNGTLILSILLGFAQQEREKISTRTKDALEKLKAKGAKLGTPANLTNQHRAEGRRIHTENAKANKENRQAFALASALRTGGANLSEISRQLNNNSFKTSRGNTWTAAGVKNLLKLYNYGNDNI